VTSYIAAPPAFIFQMTLLTLLCMGQADQVPTPTKTPRQVSDVIVDVGTRSLDAMPHGHIARGRL
jgi:hypothetical protein